MKSKITEILNKAGIRDVGFCDFKLVRDRLIDCRAKNRLPQKAKTVIVCLFPYKVKEEKPKNISRYAAVPDYHRVCGNMLDKSCKELQKHIDNHKFELFIDNSPIPEIYAASAAGLGVIGKNGLLINKKYGSFVFLGEIVTDLEIECTDLTEYCPDCNRCKEVCPVALSKKDCLSALSQRKGELDSQCAELLRQNKIIWGCDICAEVCPLNQNADTTYIKEFNEDYRNEYLENEDISGRAYEWRTDKPVKRNFKILNSIEKN